MASLYGESGQNSPFSPEFWRKPIAEQLKEIHTKRKARNRRGAQMYNVNKWIEILVDGFGLTSKDVKVDLEKSSYNAEEEERIWKAIAVNYQRFVSVAGITSEQGASRCSAVAVAF